MKISPIIIAPDKREYQEGKKSYFSTKTYIVFTHKMCLNEALLISIHNISFHGEIRKISTFLVENSALSGSVMSSAN